MLVNELTDFLTNHPRSSMDDLKAAQTLEALCIKHHIASAVDILQLVAAHARCTRAVKRLPALPNTVA